jgi:excisionase family DNA binding protein
MGAAMTKRVSPYSYYTANEAAEELGVHPEHMRRLLRQGRIKARKFGQSWAIRPVDLYLFGGDYHPEPGNRRHYDVNRALVRNAVRAYTRAEGKASCLADLMRATGLSRETVRGHLLSMEAAGEVELRDKIGKGGRVINIQAKAV